MIKLAMTVFDQFRPGREGGTVSHDALGQYADVFQGFVFTEFERAEVVVVMDGPFFGAWLGAAGQDAADGLLQVFGILVGVNPRAVQAAAVVVGERGDPDSWRISTGLLDGFLAIVRVLL